MSFVEWKRAEYRKQLEITVAIHSIKKDIKKYFNIEFDEENNRMLEYVVRSTSLNPQKMSRELWSMIFFSAELMHFDLQIRMCHGQLGNWNEKLQADSDFGNLNEIKNIDPERKYIRSTRIRIARNINNYPIVPVLTKRLLNAVEDKIKNAVASFDGELAGTYSRLRDIDARTQAEMVKRHILFKKKECYPFWPIGRGFFRNPDETILIWINEEDHLRIISMEQYGNLGVVYKRIVKALKQLKRKLDFLYSPRYGYLTSCITNCGTGLRASVHIRLPNLALDNQRLTTLANELNLQIRGTDGEHSH